MDSQSPFRAPILPCPRCRADQHFPTIPAAADYLTISSRTIYRRIEEGKAHVVRVGGNSLRVCLASLLVFDDTEDAPPRDAGNGEDPPSRKPGDADDNEDPPPPKRRGAGRS